MRNRCELPSRDRYKNYGGRGIEIGKDWKNNFLAFSNWATSNGYKKGLQIDRVDVNGNYDPSNCRFITKEEQARNKTTSLKITYLCQTRCLAEWCRILNLNEKFIWQRIRANFTFEEAILLPKKAKRWQ